MKTEAIKPDTHSWMIPFLTVSDIRTSLDFYQKTFGFKTAYANEIDGAIVHAELSYMDQTALLLTPEGQHSQEVKTPVNSKVEPAAIMFLYIENVDQVYARALANGGESIVAPATVPWGERHCHIRDIDGHRWQLAEVVHEK